MKRSNRIRESFGDRLFRNVITGILILVACIMIVPLVTEIALSFSSRTASQMNIVGLLPVGFTTESWKYVTTNGPVWTSFLISVSSTAITVVLALLINSLLAYPLSKRDFAPTRVIMLLIVFTMILKAPTIPYFLVLRDLGLVDNYWGLVVPQLLSAYNLIVMRTFFMQFPEEVEEAAEIDGCGKFAMLFRIVLPSSKAVLATVGLFYGVVTWNQYQHPMMLIQNFDMYPLQMRIRQIINGGGDVASVARIKNVNYTQDTIAAAAVVFAVVPILLIYPVLQKYFAKGAMLGSVKG